jgi:hypothetical protein
VPGALSLRYGAVLGVGVVLADADPDADVLGVAVPAGLVAPALTRLVALGSGAGGEKVE